MHTVISYLPVAAVVLLAYAADRWSKRPAARARWAKLSLRDKIARQLRALRRAITLQAGYLALITGLYLAGILSLSSSLAFLAAIAVNLAASLYLLRLTLIAQRTYNDNPAAAYIAEIRNTFGTLKS